MSLRPQQPLPPVPDDTARVARAAFPRGNPYVLLRERLGAIFADADFIDLYPRLGRTMEWDTAAGQAVLLGAGGRVVRFDDHAPLAYGKRGYENPFFIACAPGVALVEG